MLCVFLFFFSFFATRSDGKRSGLGVVTYENGDRFEGYWLDDKKEGPGRYFYLSSQKMYEGEWVNDVAKCGVYMDMPPVEDEYNLGAPLDAAPRDGQDSFVLPPLELKNADEEILHAVSDARRKRATDMGRAAMNAAQQAAAAAGEAAGAAAAGASAATFTKDELEQLTLAWERVDVDGQRWVLGSALRDVLIELGICAGADDINQLLQELGATPDSQITFEEFAGTSRMLAFPPIVLKPYTRRAPLTNAFVFKILPPSCLLGVLVSLKM